MIQGRNAFGEEVHSNSVCWRASGFVATVSPMDSMTRMNQDQVANRFVRLRALSHHVTWFLGTRFSRAIPLVFVIGYPKSGTTWVCQVAADYLQLPFPRFSILPIGCPAVVHGHERVSTRYPRCIYVMRDGRDALTSLYFFLARRLAEGNRPQLTRRQRALFPGLIDRDDVKANIARFVEGQMRHPHAAPCHWGAHVRSLHQVKNLNIVLIRYEDLRSDGETTFARAMSELTGEETNTDRIHATLDKFAFNRQAGRRPGHEDRTAFLRKGEIGDWENHFTPEAAEIFDHFCGDDLVRNGYEPDRSWVRRVSERAASREQPSQTARSSRT